MTKKDYVLIAKAIRLVHDVPSVQASIPARACAECIALAISDALVEDNRRFNPGRFLKECGIC